MPEVAALRPQIRQMRIGRGRATNGPVSAPSVVCGIFWLESWLPTIMDLSPQLRS